MPNNLLTAVFGLPLCYFSTGIRYLYIYLMICLLSIRVGFHGNSYDLILVSLYLTTNGCDSIRISFSNFNLDNKFTILVW